MVRSAASKVMWVGRATVFLIGVAVILALVFGVASTVSAHTDNKGFFHLGHKNVSGAMSRLAGKVAGPSLFIGNGSEDPKATALRLNVKPGKPPLKVNSDAKVPMLNTDKLDGNDSASFLSPERIYKVEREHTPGPNTILGGEPPATRRTRLSVAGSAVWLPPRRCWLPSPAPRTRTCGAYTYARAPPRTRSLLKRCVWTYRPCVRRP